MDLAQLLKLNKFISKMSKNTEMKEVIEEEADAEQEAENRD